LNFDKHRFWDALKTIKQEYNIKQGTKPSLKSAKRFTVLVSCAYLEANGSLHWIDCLESALFRCCKEKNLQCDKLAMEDDTQSYTCKRKGKDYGRKMYSNQFEEFKISAAEGDYPKATTFAEYLTDFLLMEVIDEQDISRNSERAGVTTNTRHQKRGIRGTQKKRLALR